MIDVQVSGDKALLKIIQELPGSFPKSILLSSLKAGARKVQQEAKRNAPVNTGDLKKAFVVQESVQSKRTSKNLQSPPEVVVGVKKPESRRLHLVEFGHITVDGGFYSGTRFFTKAAESQTTEVHSVITSKMREEFGKISRRISQDFRKLSAADKRKLIA